LNIIKSNLERDFNNRLTTDPISGFEQDLLKKFNKFNSGSGLYKSNADYTAWSEVVLNDSGLPEQIPCNN